jgi:hypothetical protein
MTTKKYMLAGLEGGRGIILEDTDLWGLVCALEDSLSGGYFKGEWEWARAMVDKLQALRGGQNGG